MPNLIQTEQVWPQVAALTSTFLQWMFATSTFLFTWEEKKLNDSKRVILVPERAFLVWPDIQYLMPPQRPFDHCAGDNDFSTLLVSGVDIELGKVHDESFD